jgi:hypothetical protein
MTARLHQSVWLTRWAYLRAFLISLGLLSQCVSALPKQPLDAERLARPETQRALRWLGVALRPFGVREPAEVERFALDFSRRERAFRSAMLRPVAPLIQGAAVRQQWHLFLTVKEQAFRLRVDARSLEAPADAWRTVYCANQTDALGLAEVLDYRRLRGIYNPTRFGTTAQYAGFVDWLMRRVWTEQPELGALRVGLERMRIGSAAAPPEVLDMSYVIERERSPQP